MRGLLRLVTGAGTLGMTLLTGCASTSTGTVVGTFQIAGGPCCRPPTPARGTVELTSNAGTRLSVEVGANGQFDVRVPIGTYTATKRTPYVDSGSTVCSADAPVTVRTDQESKVIVACQIK